MDTVEALRYCEENKILGVYVECGVMEGKHPIYACNTILENNFEKRDIYMYDTFEGLTKPGVYDYSTATPLFHMSNEQILAEWNNQKISDTTNGWCYCSLENVKSNVTKTNYPIDKLHFIKGDVMETLKNNLNLPEKIAVLRLDTDWYESSKFELEILYPKVSDGGVVILDDYFHWDGQRRATDEYFKENNIDKKVIQNNGQTGYFIK